MVTAAIGGALALGSAIYGAVASANQNNKARSLIQQQRDDNRQWYERRMNEDYISRTDAQAVINKQRELLDEQMKRARGTNIVTGGTDASVAMQKQAANDAMAQTMGGIASEAANYKERVEQQYRQEDDQLNQQQAQMHQQQAQQTAQAASQAVNAGVNLMGAGMIPKVPQPTMTNPGASMLAADKTASNAAYIAAQQNKLDNYIAKSALPKLNP